MKKLAAVAATLAFSSASMIAPALATTSEASNNPAYVKSAVDCLVLLFTNPKARAEQCGTPTTLPPPAGSTVGSKSCGLAEIDPFATDGVEYRIAGSGPIYCCGMLSPTQWTDLTSHMLEWGEPATRVAVAAC